MDRELAILESDLNCLKREREVMEQNFERRKQQLLHQSMSAVSQERHGELVRQLIELNNQLQQETI